MDRSKQQLTKRRQLMLDMCDREKGRTTRELIKSSGLSEATARQYIRHLHEGGYIKNISTKIQQKIYIKLVDVYTLTTGSNEGYVKPPPRKWNFVPYKPNQIAIEHEVPKECRRVVKARGEWTEGEKAMMKRDRKNKRASKVRMVSAMGDI